VNRLHQLLAGLGISAVVLAACGGGGSTPSTTNVAQPSQHNKIAPPNYSGRTAIGSAKLSLVLPHVVTGRNGQALHARNVGTTGFRHRTPVASATSRRAPKYINPGCTGECNQNILDIYVDGTLLTNLDQNVGNSDSMYVNGSSPDGTQAVTVPIFSTDDNDIVVVEYDSYGGSGGDIIALGETWIGQFTAGTSVNATLTMQMNAYYVGILDMYNQSNPATLQGQQYLGLGGTCGAGAQQSQFGLFTADGTGTFVPVAGYGGTSTPSLTYTSDVPGTTAAAHSNISGLYFANWDAGCDGVTISATAANPAYPAFRDARDYYGPLDSNGNETYGYQSAVSGTADILNAPLPSPSPSSAPSSAPTAMPSYSYGSSLPLDSTITYGAGGGVGISATLTFASTPAPTGVTVGYSAYNYLPQAIPTNAPNSQPSPVGNSPTVVASWFFVTQNAVSPVFLGNAGPTAVFNGVQCPAPNGASYYTFFGDATANAGQGYQAQSSCIGNTVTFYSNGSNPVYLQNGDTYVLELSYF
jgi:hypothetical protein